MPPPYYSNAEDNYIPDYGYDVDGSVTGISEAQKRENYYWAEARWRELQAMGWTPETNHIFLEFLYQLRKMPGASNTQGSFGNYGLLVGDWWKANGVSYQAGGYFYNSAGEQIGAALSGDVGNGGVYANFGDDAAYKSKLPTAAEMAAERVRFDKALEAHAWKNREAGRDPMYGFAEFVQEYTAGNPMYAAPSADGSINNLFGGTSSNSTGSSDFAGGSGGSGGSGSSTRDCEKYGDSGQREVCLTMGWLPQGALDTYMAEFIESGNSDAAWAQIRRDSRYEQWFPGNLTEDGRVRLSEEDYSKTVAAYDETFINVGLNPELFKSRYGELIRGDVSPYELETTRINPMHDRIVSQSQQLRAWYSENFNIDLTDAALIAAAIDPSLGERILTKQISMAEIGGEAAESGFDLTTDFARRIIEESGLDRMGAERMFQNAENFLPVLNMLSSRHYDADDDFDLTEFVSADLFKDPTQVRRMKRLIAQERSSFSGGQLGTGAAQSRDTGGLAGLTER